MKKENSYAPELEQLARFAKALSHPARLAILKSFMTQEGCCFTSILEELPLAKATTSQHFKELREAGLVQCSGTAPRIKYCINKENMKLAMSLFRDFFSCDCHKHNSNNEHTND